MNDRKVLNSNYYKTISITLKALMAFFCSSEDILPLDKIYILFCSKQASLLHSFIFFFFFSVVHLLKIVYNLKLLHKLFKTPCLALSPMQSITDRGFSRSRYYQAFVQADGKFLVWCYTGGFCNSHLLLCPEKQITTLIFNSNLFLPIFLLFHDIVDQD